MKKGLSICAIAIASMMMFSGCSSSGTTPSSTAPVSSGGDSKPMSSSESSKSSEPVKLSMMHYYTKEESEAGDVTRSVPRAVIEKYKTEHPEINFDITELQINDYETKIQALAAADNMPDVYVVKGSWIGNFADNGLMADMTSYVEKCEWKDSYRPNIFDPAIVDGVTYAAPTQYSATTLAFYNKAIWSKYGYNEIPKTWEEFLTAAEKISKDGVYPVVLGNKNKWQYNSSWISAIGNRYTGDEWFNNILKKDGSAHFTDDVFVNALAMTQNIGQKAGLNPDYSTIDHQQAASQYCQGKAATCIDGYWTIQYLIENSTEEVLKNTMIAPLPTVEGAKGKDDGVAAGCGWFLSANSKLEGAAKDTAMDFLLTLTGPEISKIFADEYGMVHSCTVADMDMTKFPQLQQDYVKLLDNCTPTAIYDARIDASVIATMNDLFPELLAGSIDPKAVAEQIETEYATTIK